MKVKIKDKKQLSSNLLEVQFDLLGQPFPFLAGQFFQVTLINPILTDERGNNRKFGFTNSTVEKATVSMMTKNGVSAFKKNLQELPIGAEVEIDGVNGGKRIPDDVQKPLVWIADSIGVAPFMSVIREVKAKNLSNKVDLIYVIKHREDAVFFDELEEYSKENQLFKFMPVISEVNVISQDLINKLPEFQNNSYIVTGEPNFVIPNIKMLKEIGVGQENIAMEIFTGY
jgi:predicted ferric reductase